ncbi:hypothetical protein VTK56DRAFT_5620 [Thermocarpiscus australiensis]
MFAGGPSTTRLVGCFCFNARLALANHEISGSCVNGVPSFMVREIPLQLLSRRLEYRLSSVQALGSGTWQSSGLLCKEAIARL